MIKIENLQYHRSDYFFAIDTYFIKMQGRERDTTFFFNSAFSLIQTEKNGEKQTNVVSGRPERILTALRSFSGFCDFTDGLWRSSFGSSVSIDGDKTCITRLSCGCLQEEKVENHRIFRDTGRWELRAILKWSTFLLYY